MAKRVFSFIAMAALISALCFSLLSCGREEVNFEPTSETASIDYTPYAGVTINVYNWGEYISEPSLPSEIYSPG